MFEKLINGINISVCYLLYGINISVFQKLINGINISFPLIETGGVNFQKFMIPFWRHRDQGRHLRQVSEADQSVAIQFPPAEDGDGYHRNIRIKNASVVE